MKRKRLTLGSREVRNQVLILGYHDLGHESSSVWLHSLQEKNSGKQEETKDYFHLNPKSENPNNENI